MYVYQAQLILIYIKCAGKNVTGVIVEIKLFLKKLN